jgi:hypothetical protein
MTCFLLVLLEWQCSATCDDHLSCTSTLEHFSTLLIQVVILEPNKMLTIENKKDGEQIDSLVLKT